MKNHSLLPILLLLMCVLLMPPVSFARDRGDGDPGGWEEAFFRANEAYRKGLFKEAVAGYSQVISLGHDGPGIQYNLGNAYFRTNQLGRAILAYERAHIDIPRDADLNFNLAHARDQVMDAIPPSKGFFDMAFFWLPSFSLVEVFWCFALLNPAFWAALIIRLFYRSEWLFYVLLLLLTLWLLTALSLGMKWAQIHNDDRAVILQKEVAVLAGPHEGDTLLFKLHEGSMVAQEREEGAWRLIRLPDKKRGWLRSEAVERIIPKGADTGK